MTGTRLIAAVALGCATLMSVGCKDNGMDSRPEVTRPTPGAPGALPPSTAPAAPGGAMSDTPRPAPSDSGTK